MKIVSFNVAKAIHEAGGWFEGEVSFAYDKNGTIYQDYGSGFHNKEALYLAPTYLNVWLWLWREKKIYIELTSGAVVSIQGADFIWHIIYQNNHSDPEEAIIAAIEYLINNNL